ncbi:MAG TPA: 1,2-phenylacetyl-CoA epoxidase subunit PaaC [Bacteroidia bacterium]|jgi:ring-1,2-phenylacetyl-CoA epoxidase subunit PaaC|nr:1,2-phenylacetyl-CoA epoxidase subunit PaaC [Bacteroidia bacterium]
MNLKEATFEYLLRLGDSSLIIGHRLSEWCGHGPILEEDIAMTNIALDFVGNATAILTYAAQLEGKGRTEDDLAFMRNEREFRNLLLTEQPNGDFAQTMARQFLFDTYLFFLYEELKSSKDETIAALTTKAHKEITYHLRHTREWMYRLGDGTDESHNRTQQALNNLWMYTPDLFDMDEVDQILIKEGIAPDLSVVKEKWEAEVKKVIQEATLQVPATPFKQKGSREGKHTEYLGFLLAEMQYVHRAYPGVKW